MRTRLTMCLCIGAALFGMLGAAYTHSPVPLVMMFLLGGVIAGVAMMNLDAPEWRRMTRFAKSEYQYFRHVYTRRSRHRLTFRMRMSRRMKGLNVR